MKDGLVSKVDYDRLESYRSDLSLPIKRFTSGGPASTLCPNWNIPVALPHPTAVQEILCKWLIREGSLMMVGSETSLAGKYFVDDLPGAKTAGARLYGILRRIEQKERVSALALSFLEQNGLNALRDLVTGACDYDSFCTRSEPERATRIAAAQEQSEAEFAAREARAVALQAAVQARFKAMEKDPVLRRKREARALRDRYGFGYIEQHLYPRVMKLAKRVDGGQRLAPEDVLWLATEAEESWTPEFRAAHHRLEAMSCAANWERTGDPWAAVNASGHWRKAGNPEEAEKVTDAALACRGMEPKIESALRTTRGGTLRDLHRFEEAHALGLEAHGLTPADFRPCTLLGAVSMQLGDFAAGHDWYRKAEELGAEAHAIDQELKGILAGVSEETGVRLSAYLLSQDACRFSWARR